MAAKEKVTFVRSKEFESIDDELSAALDQLEDVNQRIVDLLSTESTPVPISGLEPEPEGSGESADTAQTESSENAASSAE